MVQGEPLKQGRKLSCAVPQQHLIHRRKVLFFRFPGGVQGHIEDQGFQEIPLAIVPEVVCFPRAGIADDDIGQYLGK